MRSLNQSWLRRGVCGLLAAGLWIATTACSRSRTITTADGKVSYKEKGKDAGTITVTGKNGETASISYNENKVPADYPKDIPVYSPAKVVMSQAFSEKNARNLVLETSDASARVAEFYRKGLDGNGWKTESTIGGDKLTMFTASKEKRQLMVQITDGGDTRSIMQTLSEQQ